MSEGDSIARTLTRDDLYELVWSKPMLELAKDFGISDVALAKRCRRLAIPVPGRGYWARIDAGQNPYRPKLPEREPQWGDRSALTIQPQPVDEQIPGVETGVSGSGLSVRSRTAALDMAPSTSVIDCLDAVKRTARALKHPRRSDLLFERGGKTGPIVWMDVSVGVLDRACLLTDRILRSCAALGWSFVGQAAPPETHERTHDSVEARRSGQPAIGQVLVEGERVDLRIEERLREEPREPTPAELAREKREYGYRAPRVKYVPTGCLRVIRLDTYRTYGAPARLTWYDRRGRIVEECIPDILMGLHELSMSIKSRRAEDERTEREHQEAERRRKEFEARQEANKELIQQLETDAGAWHRARYLRRYIRAARKAVGDETIRARLGEQVIDYLHWAEMYVDQLDPLSSQARLAEFTSRAGGYVNDLDRIRAAYGRLIGSEWADAWKIGEDYSPDPDALYQYSRSVFEVKGPDEEEK